MLDLHYLHDILLIEVIFRVWGWSTCVWYSHYFQLSICDLILCRKLRNIPDPNFVGKILNCELISSTGAAMPRSQSDRATVPTKVKWTESKRRFNHPESEANIQAMHKKIQELLNHLAWNQWNKQLSTLLVISLEGNSFTGKNVLPRPCSCNLQQQKQTALQFLFWTKTCLHLKTNKINVEWLASFPFLY